MATPTKHLHPAPGSDGASVAVHAGVEQHELAAGIIMANEVDSYECSVTRKGQPFPPDHEIMSIDHHIRVMTSADGVTFDCHEQASTFCLMDAYNTCRAKQVHETENHTLAAGFEVITDVDTLDKDQLAEKKGALMVDSYECSATKKGQPIPPNHVIMSTNRHTRVMTSAAGVTFDCHEQASTFCLMDAYNTCHAKQVHETENHTLAAGFEAIADVDITKTTLTDGYRLDADVTAFGAIGKPLLALDQDQLTDGIGALMENALHGNIAPGKNVSPLELYIMMKVKYVDPSMLFARQVVVEMIGKVARVKQPVASLEACSASGISAYSMHGTKSVSPLFRVRQVLLFMLVIFLSVAQVSSSAEAKSESADIGSCRFDSMSVATLSCVDPDGSWRPRPRCHAAMLCCTQ